MLIASGQLAELFLGARLRAANIGRNNRVSPPNTSCEIRKDKFSVANLGLLQQGVCVLLPQVIKPAGLPIVGHLEPQKCRDNNRLLCRF